MQILVSVAIVSVLASVQVKEDYLGKCEPCIEAFLLFSFT